MSEKIIELDENGFFIQDIIKLSEDFNYPEHYTKQGLPVDEEGNQLPFYKPRWNGEMWVETMTQEEIDGLKNKSKVLSKIDVLKAQNTALSDRQEFLEDVIAEMAIMIYD